MPNLLLLFVCSLLLALILGLRRGTRNCPNAKMLLDVMQDCLAEEKSSTGRRA